MSARIYRYQVPVDGGVHVIELNGSPHHIGCRDRDYVEFWAIHRDAVPLREHRFTVIGTGQSLPQPHRIWGTAVAPGQTLVWHLVEVTP